MVEPDQARLVVEPGQDLGDLEARLCRALDLAEVVVDDFGDTGYTDDERRELGFGAEKVVAEATMLAYAASAVPAAPEVRSRVEALCRSLAPRVRSRRALADSALHPGRAFKYAVPHVLLTAMGHEDPGVDAFFRARCERAAVLGADLPPSAQLERTWITRLWGSGPAVDAVRQGETLLDRPVDLLSDTREDAYALTHQLFYLTDFGRTRPSPLSRPIALVLAEVEGLLLTYLDAEDYDLAGELLMAWPQLGVPWSPAAAFAFRVLARVEDEVGVLPCGNVDLARLALLTGVERTRFARATGYHTAFVMGFLCAVALRAGDRQLPRIAGSARPDKTWQRFRDLIDAGQGHWLADFDRAEASEKRVLGTMLGNLALVQALRLHDYAGLGRVLAMATEPAAPEHPLWRAAIDRLQAVGEAMRLVQSEPGRQD